MTMTLTPQTGVGRSRVAHDVQAWLPQAKRVGPTAWVASHAKDGDASARFEVRDDWLTIRAALDQPDGSVEQLSKALDWNTRLRDARFGIAHEAGVDQLIVRADVRLTPRGGGVLADTAERAWEEVRDVVAGQEPPKPNGLDASDDVSSRLDRLASVAADAGWSPKRRDEGVTVRLNRGEPSARKATLHTSSFGVEADVELLRLDEPLSDASEQAIALLLLQVGAAVRLVRPTLECDGDESVYALAVSLAGDIEERALDDALEALAVACRLVGRTLDVLIDEQMATTYLAARGRSS